ncbi:hypothetical protein ACJX0J_040450, partial [Zea mays]
MEYDLLAKCFIVLSGLKKLQSSLILTLRSKKQQIYGLALRNNTEVDQWALDHNQLIDVPSRTEFLANGSKNHGNNNCVEEPNYNGVSFELNKLDIVASDPINCAKIRTFNPIT